MFLGKIISCDSASLCQGVQLGTGEFIARGNSAMDTHHITSHLGGGGGGGGEGVEY